MPTTTTAASVDRPSFSQALRERSWSLHQQAEGASFMTSLLNGHIDLAGYQAMVTQHLSIYEALESVGDRLRDDPIAGPFIHEELNRVPSIRADLDFLRSETSLSLEPLAATKAYVKRLQETASWPGGFVAHHYTRYLGDLSGGLAIGAVVARTYGLAPGADGVRFYRFEKVKPKEFKDEYRARLDGTPWDSHERDRVIDEVLNAYRLNTDVFAELSRTAIPAGRR